MDMSVDADIESGRKIDWKKIIYEINSEIIRLKKQMKHHFHIEELHKFIPTEENANICRKCKKRNRPDSVRRIQNQIRAYANAKRIIERFLPQPEVLDDFMRIIKIMDIK